MGESIDEETDFIGFTVPASHKERLEEEAFRRSSPGDTMSLSAVAREAVAVYVEQLDQEDDDR